MNFTNSNPQIKIAVIGVGLIGPRHCATVAKSPDAQLIAVVDPMPQGVKLAAKFGITPYSSIKDLLSSPHKPDGAIVCTPNNTHAALAIELTLGGVHVLLEKPVAADLEGGQRLLQHSRQTKFQILVGHHRRFNPYIVVVKEALESRALGQIIAINGLWTLFKPPEYFEAPTEWRKSKSGGVVLMNLIHEVDLLQYMFGQITRIHAEKALSTRNHEAEEGAALTLRFESGVVGSFLIADNLPSPHNFESGTGENPLIPQTGENFYTIFGTDSSLSVPSMIRWSYDGVEKSWHVPLIPNNLDVPDGVPFELQFSHFVQVCRGNENPKCTVGDGLSALIVCEAAKRAIFSGETVNIAEFAQAVYS
ncbi:uncharacterized protein N7458_003461 [Penicillium daleae]|uniref:Uncharacterized protein n=1 Tax=Penicillium daleae TaxID=63821 RepID=A0AAD6CEY9_9EURO|nr:uncharacterized protein N7458_003461 [Penicillium daleae]KAJ5461909.1 hypothetical protein N7458_003461 [Penicillium daleae]